MTSDPFTGLDTVFHHPARIRIMSRLIVLRQVRFSRLQKLTGLSAGNLASHLHVLEQAQILELRKGFFERRVGKFAVVRPQGVVAFQEYVRKLEATLQQLKKDMSETIANPTV